MFFPMAGAGWDAFSPNYIDQALARDNDLTDYLKLLDFNKTRFSESYFWVVLLSVDSRIPSFRIGQRYGWDDFKIKIPDVVLQDVHERKCKVAYDYSLEGYTDIDWEFLYKCSPVKKDQSIFITSQYNTDLLKDSGVECYYNNMWETNFFRSYEIGSTNKVTDDDSGWKFYQKNIKRIKNKTIRPFYFTAYNRRPREHRLALLGLLSKEKLLHNSIYSWGGNFESNYVDRDLAMHVNRMYFNSDKEDIQFTHLMHISKNIVEHDVNFNTNPAWLLNWDHVYTSNFQLVSETYANRYGPFLSEKSFKPFATGQPFIMWGDTGTVDALRNHGYDTYDKWIDHSYDSEPDPSKRLKMVVSETKRLCSITQKEWANILYDMLPIIEKNNKNFTRCYHRSLQQKFNKKYFS